MDTLQISSNWHLENKWSALNEFISSVRLWGYGGGDGGVMAEGRVLWRGDGVVVVWCVVSFEVQ